MKIETCDMCGVALIPESEWEEGYLTLLENKLNIKEFQSIGWNNDDFCRFLLIPREALNIKELGLK